MIEKGLASAQKKLSKETREGVIGVYLSENRDFGAVGEVQYLLILIFHLKASWNGSESHPNLLTNKIEILENSKMKYIKMEYEEEFQPNWINNYGIFLNNC